MNNRYQMSNTIRLTRNSTSFLRSSQPYSLWMCPIWQFSLHGPLTRYVKLPVAHASGMPVTFPRHRLERKPRISDPGIHHGITSRTCRDTCRDCKPSGVKKTFPAILAHAKPAILRTCIWQEAFGLT